MAADEETGIYVDWGPSGKTHAKGYNPSPFFFLEHSDEFGQRLVAWSRDVEQIKCVYFQLLGGFPDGLEVLLKVSRGDEDDEWDRYLAADLFRSEVEEAVQACEELIFHDAFHEFFIRRPDTDDYFGLDEYGNLFIYPTDPDPYAELLKAAGFEERQQEPIWSQPCWRSSPPTADQLQESLIRRLELRQVDESGAEGSSRRPQ